MDEMADSPSTWTAAVTAITKVSFEHAVSSTRFRAEGKDGFDASKGEGGEDCESHLESMGIINECMKLGSFKRLRGMSGVDDDDG